jgi:hypothetical protein
MMIPDAEMSSRLNITGSENKPREDQSISILTYRLLGFYLTPFNSIT